MDARSPLVVRTHELGRRAGGMRTVEREVPAPGEMGTEVIRVPEGSPMTLAARLESVVDGVLVTGTVDVSLAGECVRCLRDLTDRVSVDVSELYYYPSVKASLVEDGDEEAADLPELAGELLDLEPAVRDAVVLALPFRPLCRPDCPGLCADCGIRLDDAEPDHHHEVLDPRWAALSGLLGDGGEHADDGGENADDGGAAGDR